ncbi:MAG: RHS repeat-associated core domain-containing protein [Fimbriimonadaceae bacterium]
MAYSRFASISASAGSDGYTYSAFGTRAKAGTRAFLRAGAGVTAGVLDDGNAVYTPGVSEKRGSVTTFSHSGLKNTGAQTDAPASGDPSVAATREHDAFGAPTASSGSWQGPFGYAGQFDYQTEASGLHLLGHRYYDASLGRFLTRDPIGDGSNWYAYCANDPLAFAYPDGLAKIIVYWYNVQFSDGYHMGISIDGRYFAGGPSKPWYDDYAMLSPRNGRWGGASAESVAKKPEGVVLVDDARLSARRYIDRARQVEREMISRPRKYELLDQNSNSWARHMITRLGLRDEFDYAMRKREREYPKLGRWFPGFERVLWREGKNW